MGDFRNGTWRQKSGASSLSFSFGRELERNRKPNCVFFFSDLYVNRSNFWLWIVLWTIFMWDGREIKFDAVENCWIIHWADRVIKSLYMEKLLNGSLKKFAKWLKFDR